MRFLPYPQTASVPNIIVDGPRNAATVLALSHWSGSGTPPELRADTSTEIVFNYRYEGWVQMASRRPLLRVDLSNVAAELNLEQAPPGRWVFDDVESIIPRLRLEGGAPSSVSAEDVLKRIEHQLQIGAPAWNPYD